MMDSEILERLRTKSTVDNRDDYPDLNEDEFEEVWTAVQCSDLRALITHGDNLRCKLDTAKRALTAAGFTWAETDESLSIAPSKNIQETLRREH